MINKEGHFPLHAALIADDEALASSLINEGADINARDASGKTALHLAIINGQKEMAKLLINRGADEFGTTACDHNLFSELLFYRGTAVFLCPCT